MSELLLQMGHDWAMFFCSGQLRGMFFLKAGRGCGQICEADLGD